MTERMSVEELREARAVLGLTTAGLADALSAVTGRSLQGATVRKWEAGASLIPYSVPAELVEVAGRRVAEIVALREVLENRGHPPTCGEQ